VSSRSARKSEEHRDQKQTKIASRFEAYSIPMKITSILLGVAASLCAPAAPAVDISGSGSTFVHAVMLRWAADYFAKTGVAVSYDAIGSSAGIKQVKAGTVTFGASDRPLVTSELVAAGLAQFPLVIGGVVPVVNLDGIKPGQLNLTGELLADIFLGKIAAWSDPAIAALNPKVKLPDLQIRIAYRADGSGSTFNWTNYLSKVSPEWKSKVGEGSIVRWPTGTGHEGSEGIASYVSYVRGSIGYVELAFAIRHEMAFAKVRKRSGAFVAPSADSFREAATTAGWNSSDFYEILTDAPGKDAWPIAATTFVLMPRHPGDEARSAAALRFFRWALEQGQEDAKSLRYVPLPDTLVKRVEDYWGSNIR
jgi:phosphate transport system substrate-binding protein